MLDRQDEFKAAGYRKLHELRLLKAAAARLLLQPQEGQQQSPRSSSSFCHVSPLLRSFSNIEHVMPSQPQRLSRASSMSIDRPTTGSSLAQASPAPPPPGLGRSNSAGSNRLSTYAQQQQQQQQQQHLAHQLLMQPPSLRFQQAPPAGVAEGGSATFQAAAASPWLPRPPRHSEPAAAGGALGADERVELLLAEVESLLADRQQLTARCCTLQKDNDQLAELVGRLTRTVQEQESQLQQQQQQQQQHKQNNHSGDCLGSLPSLSLPPAVNQAAVPANSSAAAGLPSLQQQQHLQRQRRVDEWLGPPSASSSSRHAETWQEWQERLPLEHMNSGSSSTLTVALDQQ